ncbi:hypothetical protein Bca52824_072713 [Brassica carinata]|uniref:Uncharacterized protein n=1 Tax=Brassica carinata TaxID=52824 RepID=A0A8X7U570_BRACI|nr:hypothetical protein Bca52824_072713 [Brassica carinata]
MTYRLPELMLIPDGSKTPPITILQTLDVQVMMAVRAWFADLALFFFCRADFNIGSSSYKFGNGNEDPSFEGKAVVASQAVLEEYFNDQEMMVIHRVHLEMEKEKLELENQRSYELVYGNKIIVIDDTDSDGDGTEPLGSNKLSITVFNTGLSSNQESPFPTNGLIISDEINDVALDSEYIPQPNVSNNSPMEYYKGILVQFAVDEGFVIVQPSSPPIDDGISFWEGVIASENDNDVKDEEHSDEMDLDIPMSQNISQLQQNGTINVDHANSSIDSTPDLNEVNIVVLSWENVSDNLSNTQLMYDNLVVSEGMYYCVLDDTLVIYNGETMLQNSASPSISETVGLIPNPANADDNLVINLDYSSSEDSMDSVSIFGNVVGVENGYDEVNVKILAEYKYVFPQQIMLGQKKSQRMFPR